MEKKFCPEELKAKIREIPDFPIPGVSYKDITTLLKDGDAFRSAIKQLAGLCRGKNFDLIVGPEARGFLAGAPLAYELAKGFVPVRKAGKLPAECHRGVCTLEYGVAELEVHKDAVNPGQKVLVVDDLLATGGTVFTTIDMVRKMGAEITAVAFLIELTYLNGRENLRDYDVISLLKY